MADGRARKRQNVGNPIFAARNESKVTRFIQNNRIRPGTDRNQRRQRAHTDINDRGFAIGTGSDEAIVSAVMSKAGRCCASWQGDRRASHSPRNKVCAVIIGPCIVLQTLRPRNRPGNGVPQRVSSGGRPRQGHQSKQGKQRSMTHGDSLGEHSGLLGRSAACVTPGIRRPRKITNKQYPLRPVLMP
jgi:hypothetical protein